MRNIFLILACCCPLLAQTRLNENDKHPTIALTANGLGASFTEWIDVGVRSEDAIMPRSGFYYFEGKRLLDKTKFGFGIGTEDALLDQVAGFNSDSIGCSVSDGCNINGSGVGITNYSGDQDTYGFAVDYRGDSPIIHVIASTSLGGDGVYLGKATLPVTTPVYIMVWGTNSHGILRQTINGGDDLGNNPFRYDPIRVLTEAYFYEIDGVEELVVHWGEPDPGLNQFPVLDTTDEVVVLGNPVTLEGSAIDPEEGDLSAAIQWSAASGPSGSGASFSYTPLLLGTDQVQATATDSGNAGTTVTVTVTVIASASEDTDGDGLTFSQEAALGTDPAKADTDGDGLSDSQEVNLYQSDPLLADGDGDGIGDLFEGLYGLIPNRDDSGEDPDGDGHNNAAEAAAGTEPLNANSHPDVGRVVLNESDKDPSITIGNNGLGFSVSGGSVAGVRSDVSIAQGSGWSYYEGRRQVNVGNFGFGLASATAPLNEGGGTNAQSLGVDSTGNVRYNNIVQSTFGDTSAVDTYGIAVDYNGTNPIVYPLVTDINDNVLVLPSVTMSSVTTALHIYVYGASMARRGFAASQQIINAGADPTGNPFCFPAAYHLFLERFYDTNGSLDAEFLGNGWGPDHAWTATPEVPQFETVQLLQADQTGAGIRLGPDKLGVRYTINDKMAILANQSMIGQFRYFETFRSIGPFNMGQGLITAYGELNPYCCVSVAPDGAPPSMSVNSSADVWRNLVSQISYDPTPFDTYGFAVDYRGARPIVYVIINDTLIHTMTMDDLFVPVFPMLYGNRQEDPVRDNTANFGASAFTYDAVQILTNAAIDTSELILGWGDANDGRSPRITGQTQVTTLEETSKTLVLSDLISEDPDAAPRGVGLNLTVGDGSNYTRVGNTLTPALNYDGRLAVPVTVSDGTFTSRSYRLILWVTNINDPATISAQQSLQTPEDVALQIPLSALTVTDVDNVYPDDFTLIIGNGTHYTHSGDTITPELEYSGPLTVPVTVHDGVDNSNVFNLDITVTSVNDSPEVLAQVALSTPEETDLTLTLGDFTIFDPDIGMGSFNLNVQPGADYTLAGDKITPVTDFNGVLTVPVTVDDGVDMGPSFDVAVTVTPINDVPEVVAQLTPLLAEPGSDLTILSAYFDVSDPDDTWPDDFTFSVDDGANYTLAGKTITPDLGFEGLVAVPVTVHDGQAFSLAFNLEVTVCALPALQTSPLSQLACSGSALILSVASSGPGPLTFQWYKNGGILAAETETSLSLDPLALADAGLYYCVVGNDCGSRTSAVATLDVIDPVAFTQQPESIQTCPGLPVTFQVTATGAPPLSYQWYKGMDLIPAAEEAGYTIVDPTEVDNGTYHCEVSNDCGPVSSEDVTLLVDGPLELAIDPANAAAGLEAICLNPLIGCALPEISWQWFNEANDLIGENAPLVLNPPFPESTTYRLEVTDAGFRQVGSASMTLLVGPTQYLDYNGDGFNDLNDLTLFLSEWGQATSIDPNDNGVKDVLDALYIAIGAGQANCDN